LCLPVCSFSPRFEKTAASEIPRKTIYRLSVTSVVCSGSKATAIRTVSSEPCQSAGVNPQLRKDLTYFGQFGTRGLGYDANNWPR